MPKVLRILNRLNIGGPTFNAGYLTKYLEPDYETLLVAGQKDEAEASSDFIIKDLGLKPVYIPDMYRAINPLNDRKAYRHLRQLIREYQPDIVHTHAAKAGALGRLAAIHENVPVVLHTFHGHVFHSYFNPIKTQVFLRIERYLAKRSSRIIAISRLQKQELGEVFKVAPLDKIEQVPLGFNLARFQEGIAEKRITFRKKYQLADDEIAIGIIGRLAPVKNHPLFLQALKQVLGQTDKKVRAFIIGDGEEREALETLAEELSIPFATEKDLSQPQPLTFTSWIREIDVANAGLDAVVLCSLNEGTPVSLIEAQAANKPIISTRVGGIEDVVKEGETALLSDSGDVNGFAQNLLQLIETEGMLQQMGRDGAAYVMERYSYQRLVSDMKELYDRLLGINNE